MGPRKPLLCTLSWGSERRGWHDSKAVCSGRMQRGRQLLELGRGAPQWNELIVRKQLL